MVYAIIVLVVVALLGLPFFLFLLGSSLRESRRLEDDRILDEEFRKGDK